MSLWRDIYKGQMIDVGNSLALLFFAVLTMSQGVVLLTAESEETLNKHLHSVVVNHHFGHTISVVVVSLISAFDLN